LSGAKATVYLDWFIGPVTPRSDTYRQLESNTGAGLAVARQGVQRMGGQIGVESKLGSGSRFWIDLLRFPEAA